MQDDNIYKGKLGEDFVNQLAYTSILKYWCYPNVKDEKGDNKEICDLLVLFKNICIIIAVKNYAFDGNYDRYFRKTTEKAIKQLNGAQRKLFDFPRPIIIKHPDRPEEIFDKSKHTSVFKIIVNLGEGLELYHSAHISPKGEFITILDKETVEILFRELDTLADLTDYLHKREQLLKRQTATLILSQEKDLLALFIRHGRAFPPEFMKEGYSLIILDTEGEWDKMQKEEKDGILKKKLEDKASYFIDELTERDINKLPDGWLISQELLSLNRFARRTLAKLFFEFYGNHEGRVKRATGHRYFELENIGFVFFYYSPDIIDTNLPDLLMQTAIIGYKLHTETQVPRLIGIGTTNNMEQFKFAMLDSTTEITEEVIAQTKEVIARFGWFQNVKSKRFKEREFPDTQ